MKDLDWLIFRTSRDHPSNTLLRARPDIVESKAENLLAWEDSIWIWCFQNSDTWKAHEGSHVGFDVFILCSPDPRAAFCLAGALGPPACAEIRPPTSLPWGGVSKLHRQGNWNALLLQHMLHGVATCCIVVQCFVFYLLSCEHEGCNNNCLCEYTYIENSFLSRRFFRFQVLLWESFGSLSPKEKKNSSVLEVRFDMLRLHFTLFHIISIHFTNPSTVSSCQHHKSLWSLVCSEGSLGCARAWWEGPWAKRAGATILDQHLLTSDVKDEWLS